MAPERKFSPLLRYYRRQSEALFGGLRNGRAAKRALEQSERRFRAIVEDQTEMICRFGPDFRINFSNRAHARFVGDEPETLLGRDFLDSFPARIQKSLRAGLQALTAEDLILRCEHDRTTEAGEVQWFAWTNRALFDEAGQCLGYQSVGRDITARKRAEDALRESEMRFRTIVEDQTEFISRCTPDFRFTFVNEAYARQLERPRDEIIGTSVLKLMTPDQRAQFIAQLLELTPSSPTVSYEMSSVASDGRLLWEQWTDRALFDERGQLVGYQSVGRDITKSKTIEATLKASAEELALIADCMPVAMAIARVDPTEILFQLAGAGELRPVSRLPAGADHGPVRGPVGPRPAARPPVQARQRGRVRNVAPARGRHGHPGAHIGADDPVPGPRRSSRRSPTSRRASRPSRPCAPARRGCRPSCSMRRRACS